MDDSLQSRLHKWRVRNFPDADAEQQLLGIVEEVGELAHAFLKGKQGIRGTRQSHSSEEMDAVGDILIYLAGFCSYRGYDMNGIYVFTTNKVMARDWIKYPFDGFTR